MQKDTKGERPLSLSQEISIPMKALEQHDYLGEGGFGKVYSGTWSPTALYKKRVALKQLHEVRVSEKLLHQFEAEVKIHSTLESPHIVKLYGVTLNQPFCLVMELMSAGPLDRYLQQYHPSKITWTVRIQLAQDIVMGLDYLHSQKPLIIHADLKSSNVLLDTNCRAKLCDFGLALIQIKTESERSCELDFPKSRGTMQWKAPELFNLGSCHSRKSDVYAFGMIMWELSTHQYPFTNDGNKGKDAIIHFIKRGDLDPFPPGTPGEYKQLGEACRSKEKEKRPNTAKILVQLRGMVNERSDQVSNSQSLLNSNQHMIRSDGASSYSVDSDTASAPKSGSGSSLNSNSPSNSNQSASRIESTSAYILDSNTTSATERGNKGSPSTQQGKYTIEKEKIGKNFMEVVKGSASVPLKKVGEDVAKEERSQAYRGQSGVVNRLAQEFQEKAKLESSEPRLARLSQKQEKGQKELEKQPHQALIAQKQTEATRLIKPDQHIPLKKTEGESTNDRQLEDFSGRGTVNRLAQEFQKEEKIEFAEPRRGRLSQKQEKSLEKRDKQAHQALIARKQAEAAQQIKPDHQNNQAGEKIKQPSNERLFDIQDLLVLVARGSLEGVQRCLERDGELVSIREDINDLSKRTFNRITAFQYAYWAQDIEMCELILRYLPPAEAADQLSEFLYERMDIVKLYGVNYSLEPYLMAMKKYMANEDKWSESYKQGGREAMANCWCLEVGGAQKNFPAWMIMLMREGGKEVAWVKQDLSRGFQRHEKYLGSWFIKDNSYPLAAQPKFRKKSLNVFDVVEIARGNDSIDPPGCGFAWLRSDFNEAHCIVGDGKNWMRTTNDRAHDYHFVSIVQAARIKALEGIRNRVYDLAARSRVQL